MKRAFAVLTIVLSVLVLLISIGGIAGTWVVNHAATTAVTGLFAGIEKTAGAMRGGVSRVDTGVARIGGAVATIETATAQLGGNITDKGLVMTLLPEQKEQELEASIQGVRDAFADIRDVIAAGFGLYRAIDSVPFVSLPKPDEEDLQAAGEAVDRLAGQVQKLKAEIAGIRSGASAVVSKVTDAAARVNEELSQVQTRLAAVDARLAETQARANHLQQVVPGVFLVVSCLVTLLMAWVAYSEVVLIRQAWAELRKPGREDQSS
jgi:hypothetical protein